MQEESTIAKRIGAMKEESQYDTNIKFLLAQKIILAHILVASIQDFKGMEPDEVVHLIEGKPQVAEIPIEEGETNSPDLITGINGESAISYEGVATFDVVFEVRINNQPSYVKIKVDIEAQKDYYPGYDIVTRGIFNNSRLISSQKDKEFTHSDYNKIVPVYSIWICMKVPKYAQNTITEFSITQKNIIGSFPKNKVYYDIPHVIIIGLSEETIDTSDNIAVEKINAETIKNTTASNETIGNRNIFRLLNTYLSNKLDAQTKKQILETEFNIHMTQEMEGRMNIMCNLSQAIKEEALEEGKLEGRLEGRLEGKLEGKIELLYELGHTPAQIAERLLVSIEYVEGIIKNL